MPRSLPVCGVERHVNTPGESLLRASQKRWRRNLFPRLRRDESKQLAFSSSLFPSYEKRRVLKSLASHPHFSLGQLHLPSSPIEHNRGEEKAGDPEAVGEQPPHPATLRLSPASNASELCTTHLPYLLQAGLLPQIGPSALATTETAFHVKINPP